MSDKAAEHKAAEHKAADHKKDAEHKADAADAKKADDKPASPMFRVKKSLTGGHEPGELKSAADLIGPDPAHPRADLDWLIKTGGIEPADGLYAAKTTETELHDEIERLTAEVDRLRSENDHLREQWGKTPAAPPPFPVHPTEVSAGKPPPQALDSGGPKRVK